MIDSANEEKDHQETEAAQGGEETCALRRGSKESMEREEITVEMIMAGIAAYQRLEKNKEHFSKNGNYLANLCQEIFISMQVQKP